MTDAKTSVALSSNIPPAATQPALPRRSSGGGITGYARLLPRWLAAWVGTDRALRQRLAGYPKNHAYLPAGWRLVPSFRLYSRWSRIAELYPESVTSLLDVGCCRGYFVLDAASRPECRSAVGIDVVEPFVEIAREAARRTDLDNARFSVSSLDAFADRQAEYGGPFQVVLVLNVYHYLYYGSDLDRSSLGTHREILRRLAQVCSDRVIFSSPLELSECPSQVKKAAAQRGDGAAYTAAQFRDAAAEFFTIEDHGVWGKRPLLVLKRRPSTTPPASS